METLTISTSLLDREDLDIYAKMCCIILARLTQEEGQKPLTLEDLSLRMGCTTRVAGRALEQLIDKGLLIEEPALQLTELKSEARRVRRRDSDSPAANFETFDKKPKQPLKELLEALRTFIREPATDGTLRIILNMAGDDVERIRTAYQSAAALQISDTLEALMNILQQGEPVLPENPAPPQTAQVEELEPETRQVLTQINQKRIAELYTKSKQKRGGG